MADRQTRRRDEGYGRLYRGSREGQWSWVLHRVTGVVVILFLFAHVLDTAVVGWGPAAYDRVVSIYKNPVVQLLEWILVAAVLFHAFNGVRIMIVDFWPRAARRHRELSYGTIGVFVAVMIWVSIVMLPRVFR